MRQKLIFVVLLWIDIGIILGTPYLALGLRFEDVIPEYWMNVYYANTMAMLIVYLSVFWLLRLYTRLWQYASLNELFAIVTAVILSSGLLVGSALIGIVPWLPKSVYLLNCLLGIFFVSSSRLGLRIYYYFRTAQYKRSGTPTLIVGAGDAGVMLARELSQRYYESKKLIGFIDDDKSKLGHRLVGAKVLGRRNDLGEIIKKFDINEVIIAMPSAGGNIIREVMNTCQQYKCVVKTLPGLYELIDGDITVNQLRTISVEDLLRREPVKLDMEAIEQYLKGKHILVTGAGGSIGSEICRQVAKMRPKRLVLLGKGENSIYEIRQELVGYFPEVELIPVIADVRDKKRLKQVFEQVQPQVVFHAAAHKHVPLMEVQPVEAVRNNVFGTKAVAEIADELGVESFIMISTDKAVNPSSVMGATKRVAELIIQEYSQRSKTIFAAVRFGNVLGSRGSVLPLFRKQIASGGPVTVTDPEMKRYFMTIPEASQLVLQAGAQAIGGEVFVLDMGEPVKIVDLAKDVIRLSGLEPEKDISISFCGLRPGEKLFEELLTAEEGTESTRHEKIFVANIKCVNKARLDSMLEELKIQVESDKIISLLKDIVPTYQPNH
ncbi:polysaccharide biosynthesis protein [Anaeroarcus burkinensis]|uniref:polysaccharide biosynthesis protein n=1 Tax=Anaeroarcus burkinensis TaxID=82376 RepID=UPI0003F852EE|nr:nucleoside-diphosphate sugar epimerase/dehydratase [Anaeroarcus burkinensis]